MRNLKVISVKTPIYPKVGGRFTEVPNNSPIAVPDGDCWVLCKNPNGWFLYKVGDRTFAQIKEGIEYLLCPGIDYEVFFCEQVGRPRLAPTTGRLGKVESDRFLCIEEWSQNCDILFVANRLQDGATLVAPPTEKNNEYSRSLAPKGANVLSKGFCSLSLLRAEARWVEGAHVEGELGLIGTISYIYINDKI